MVLHIVTPLVSLPPLYEPNNCDHTVIGGRTCNDHTVIDGSSNLAIFFSVITRYLHDHLKNPVPLQDYMAFLSQ